MANILRIDIVHTKQTIIAALVAIAILIIAIIIGASGPPVHDTVQYSAYDCEDGSHDWDPSKCNGVQLFDNTTFWGHQSPTLGLLNGYVSLQFTPYTRWNTQDEAVVRSLDIIVRWVGFQSDGTPVDIEGKTVTETIGCPRALNGLCETYQLVIEDSLDYALYSAQVQFMNAGAASSNSTPFLGDVVFTFVTANANYNKLEVVSRLIFMVVDCALLIAFVLKMRSLAYSEWAPEQQWALFLLIGVILSNNPFYGFQFVFRTWFFHSIDALFAIGFFSVLFLFSLSTLDKFRPEKDGEEINWRNVRKLQGVYLIQLLLVLVHAILGFVLFTWANIRDSLSPIETHSDTITSFDLFYFANSFFFIIIYFWITILTIRGIAVARGRVYLFTRFLHVAVPVGLVMFSLILGLLFGNYGPLTHSALEMMYFLTLFNVFVWFMLYGYWPVQQVFSGKNPSEAGSSRAFAEISPLL